MATHGLGQERPGRSGPPLEAPNTPGTVKKDVTLTDTEGVEVKGGDREGTRGGRDKIRNDVVTLVVVTRRPVDEGPTPPDSFDGGIGLSEP